MGVLTREQFKKKKKNTQAYKVLFKAGCFCYGACLSFWCLFTEAAVLYADFGTGTSCCCLKVCEMTWELKQEFGIETFMLTKKRIFKTL